MAGIKRKADMEIPITDENDILKVTCLGGGQEVGRSSILLEYKGKTILVGLFFFISTFFFSVSINKEYFKSFIVVMSLFLLLFLMSFVLLISPSPFFKY